MENISRYRKQPLPIILSHATRTGAMIFQDPKIGGRDVVIVGLKHETPRGASFEVEDVEWVKGVLHFSDVEALESMVTALSAALEEWRCEDEQGKQ